MREEEGRKKERRRERRKEEGRDQEGCRKQAELKEGKNSSHGKNLPSSRHRWC